MKTPCESFLVPAVLNPCWLGLGSLCLIGHLRADSGAVSIDQVRLDDAVLGAVEGREGSLFPVAVDLALGWESRYASEGRDNLDGDGLLTTTLELGYQGLAVGAWYANSPEQSYDQIDAWVEYSHEIGDFEFSVAYTHLRSPSEGLHDNEIGLGLGYGALPWNLEFSALGYYSFESDGAFFELGLSCKYEIQPWLNVNPYLLFGMNSGYIADGHNGANNVVFGLEADIPLSACLSVVGHLSYNVAIDSDAALYAGDESLGDFFHGGVSLVYSF